MSEGFIFNWKRTDLAGRIHVTDDPEHEGENAAFGLSACSPGLRKFLVTHDSPPTDPIKVTFDLFMEDGDLFASNVD
jgi:hypothetical protein